MHHTSPMSNADLDSVIGAFEYVDRSIFRTLLADPGSSGDIAELGVFHGQSAILLGEYIRDGEVLTVIDLFDSPADDLANQQENQQSYPDLTRAAFEANYLRFHRVLPTVVQGFSQEIGAHARQGTHRFVHIDASHLFEHVVGDIAATLPLLNPEAIVVFDDIRQEHTPGVAAAAWQAVGRGELIPFAISPYKLYTARGGVDRYQALLREWLNGEQEWVLDVQSINSHTVLRVTAHRGVAKYANAKRYFPEVAWPLLTQGRHLAQRLKRRS